MINAQFGHSGGPPNPSEAGLYSCPPVHRLLDPERPSYSTREETKAQKLLLPDHMIYPLIYSFYKYLLAINRVPGTLLGTGATQT